MNNKEDIMDNDKTKATESDRHKETNEFLKTTAAANTEPLVLRPEWEYKPKDLESNKKPSKMVHIIDLSKGLKNGH